VNNPNLSPLFQGNPFWDFLKIKKPSLNRFVNPKTIPNQGKVWFNKNEKEWLG